MVVNAQRQRGRLRRIIGCGALGLSLFTGVTAAPGGGSLEAGVTVDPSADSLGRTYGGAISADGRYVTLSSDAPDLVPGQADTNRLLDSFLHDRTSGITTLVSHTAGSPNTASNGGGLSFGTGSFAGLLSADGRYDVFLSASTDLVPGMVDGNQDADAFLYDRLTGQTLLVSHADGQPTMAANGPTVNSPFSADGNFIAFTSTATNLVPGQIDTNLVPGAFQSGYDAFLYERASGTTTLISRQSGSAATTGNGGTLVNGISADGEFVLLESMGTDLVPGLVDTNNARDIFVYQRSSGTFTLVSRANGSPHQTANGGSGGSQMSADGRFIAFQSRGTNLIPKQAQNGTNFNEFLFDRVTGEMRLVSHTRSSARTAAGVAQHTFSADGRYIAFASASPILVPGQVDKNGALDLFLYDRKTGATSLITHTQKSPTTTLADSSIGGLAISGDGRYVVFNSTAVDLVPHQSDTPGTSDVFIFDRLHKSLALVSHGRDSLTTAANGVSSNFQISSDGSAILFTSLATDLSEDPIASGGIENAFVYDVSSGSVELVSRRP
ncbi:MAG TPA: hypothetical protein VLX28_04330 [Thermoanaerobaculia bacterium]|nr:hypothetical protein [Thermoanaerobaculia bacterium]